MIGAELNAAIQEQWPAPDTHTHQLRNWLEEKADAVKTTADKGRGGQIRPRE